MKLRLRIDKQMQWTQSMDATIHSLLLFFKHIPWHRRTRRLHSRACCRRENVSSRQLKTQYQDCPHGVIGFREVEVQCSESERLVILSLSLALSRVLQRNCCRLSTRRRVDCKAASCNIVTAATSQEGQNSREFSE